MAFWEVILYAINFTVVYSYLKVSDIGGTLVIHLFGAYFGLAVSAIISPKGPGSERRYHKGLEATYTSDLFALIGTVFLWVWECVAS
jgi:ammonium transporter Rh